MKPIEKLIKYVGNFEEDLSLKHDETFRQKIVMDAVRNYEIDASTIEDWIQKNKKSIALIRNYNDEDAQEKTDRQKNFPFSNSSTYIYPLIAEASIHLSARYDSYLVRNNTTLNFAVHGEDPQKIIQMKADRCTEHMNYQLLEESDTWLTAHHKINMTTATWGTAFARVYRDHINSINQVDMIAPEDVVINNYALSLPKAERITVKHYMTINDIYEQIEIGRFNSEIDLDMLNKYGSMEKHVDPNDTNPVLTINEQFCKIDFDEDGYKEPYYVWYHSETRTLLAILPAFEVEGIKINKLNGRIKAIEPNHNIVDFHAITDPNGRFYSIGLNYLLYNNNRALNTIVRSLTDSGTLANQQGGFVTRGFNTEETMLKFRMGEFKKLDIPPHMDIRQQIMPLPFKEPSTVLLGLLDFLTKASKELGFISEVMTGNTEVQNVPATTMLAVIDNGTRAIKPLIQKLQASLKKEFKILFDLNSKYLTDEEYQKFHNNPHVFAKSNERFNIIGDYEHDNFDLTPVANPELANEAYRYARVRALIDAVQNLPGTLNPERVAQELLMSIHVDNIQEFMPPPQPPPPPDPKLLDVKVKSEKLQHQKQMDMLKIAIEKSKQDTQQLKEHLKFLEVQIKQNESGEKQKMNEAKAFKDMHEGKLKERKMEVAEFDAQTKRMQAEAAKDQATTARETLKEKNKSGE
ncbi:MAG: hypothetical protein ACFFD1_00160 [Candidatus Thorarchaeota archaeon]